MNKSSTYFMREAFRSGTHLQKNGNVIRPVTLSLVARFLGRLE